MMKPWQFCLLITFCLLVGSFGRAQQRRKVIINEDCSGPGGSNLQTVLMLIQSPHVEVLRASPWSPETSGATKR